MCKVEDESMEHFMTCTSYGEKSLLNKYFKNYPDEQNLITKEIKRRHLIRKSKLDEVGLPQINLAPILQRPVELQ